MSVGRWLVLGTVVSRPAQLLNRSRESGKLLLPLPSSAYSGPELDTSFL